MRSRTINYYLFYSLATKRRRGLLSAEQEERITKRKSLRRRGGKQRTLKQGDAVEDLGHINGMWGDGSEDYPYPAFDVIAGKCYRVRMICVAGYTQGYGAYISNHTMSLIAVDAVNV